MEDQDQAQEPESPAGNADGNSPEQEQERLTSIHAVRSFVLALLILIVASALLIVLVLTKEDPEKKEQRELVTSVRVQAITPSEHRVEIRTQGVVSSLREVRLAAEVGGRVVDKAPQLLVGGAVAKGQVLLQIDPADYEAVKARAESALAEAQLALEQEQAMAEQAVLDWRKLGRGEPSDLVLRKPQLVAAKARVESARAELQRAGRDLERTLIRAPFDARVRAVSVEVGTVLAPGTPVAELYSGNELEVRLPFSLLDYGFLDPGTPTPVILEARVGGQPRTWRAELVRLDGEVQRRTLSAYGMARVLPDEQGGLPPVGLFVEATVQGPMLEQVVVVPRSAVRGSGEVWVEQKGRLERREVTVLRSTSRELVVRAEFQDGDQLVLTRLAAPLVGMKVEALDAEDVEPGTP